MFNDKGSTLIESLFAFEIFISVLVVYVSLFSTLNTQEIRVRENYAKIQENEECIQKSEDFVTLIEMVLH